MKGNILIKQLAALFLFFVFLQKAGAGLILHNLFHGSKNYFQKAETNKQNSADLSNTCKCEEHFLAPFTPADPSLENELSVSLTLPVECYRHGFIPVTPVDFFLRGPPAL